MKKLPLTLKEPVPSPSLLLDTHKVESNIEQMIGIAGENFRERLRPHLKTHKMSALTKIQIKKGITKFKASTIKEAEMAATIEAKDILLAHQPVGPNIDRLKNLVESFPKTSFAAITDNISTAKTIAKKIGAPSQPFRLFIDINCGMNRTGISFDEPIASLRESIANDDSSIFSGFHIYDGHLHQPSIDSRKKSVLEIKKQIANHLKPSTNDEVIVGGSPTFALWAELSEWNLSPGTVTLWDQGYSNLFPDLNFEIAAHLLTRVISKPNNNLLCLDLGHKSVAAENPLEKRVYFPEIETYKIISQSEEHLVIDCPESDKFEIGQHLIGYPQHICPTVALHSKANLIINNNITSKSWEVTSRNRV